MNRIRLIPVLTFALLAVLIFSCKKNKNDPSGGTGNTDLQVYVLNSSQQVVSGAVVSLYTSKSDRDAGTNAINSQTTSAKGFIYFSGISAVTYYVSVTKQSGNATESGNGDTGVAIKTNEQTALTVVIH